MLSINEQRIAPETVAADQKRNALRFSRVFLVCVQASPLPVLSTSSSEAIMTLCAVSPSVRSIAATWVRYVAPLLALLLPPPLLMPLGCGIALSIVELRQSWNAHTSERHVLSKLQHFIVACFRRTR